MIAEARSRAQQSDLPITFETGDAQSLRFPDSTFDAVRAERMLMHVPDTSKALQEMARVLRPRGRMAAFDIDWETQFCDSPCKETTRKITSFFCDGLRHGWIGRRLPRMFREAGMTDISTVYHIKTIPYEFLQLILGGHK